MTTREMPAMPASTRRAVVARQAAGFVAAVLVAVMLGRAWPADRWPGRLVVSFCVAVVAGNLVVHALTPPPRPRWSTRIAEVALMAVLSGLILRWMVTTWP